MPDSSPSLPPTFARLLEDDVVAITGAGRGIGRALALGCAAAGARLALLDLDPDNLDETVRLLGVAGPEVHAEVLDVGDAVACARFAEVAAARLGPVSVLVNNAGIIALDKLDSASAARTWARGFRVNVDGTLNMVLACLDQLKATHGRIINFSSTSALMAGDGAAAYAAAKGAVLSLTRALAVELGRLGIRVNAIAPGSIDTPIFGDGPRAPEIERIYMSRTPLGKFGQPEDLVGPVLFLASRMSSHVTGITLPVDGGYLATGLMRS